MSLSTRPARSGRTLMVSGEIDLGTRDQLYAALLDALDQQRTVIGVNFRAVTFLDCSAIGILVSANNIARSNGQALNVTHPRGLVREILDVTGVRTYLRCRRYQRARLRQLHARTAGEFAGP